MAEVHAVEVANGDRSAPQVGGEGIKPVEMQEGTGHWARMCVGKGLRVNTSRDHGP
jgi:hypothetical protein